MSCLPAVARPSFTAARDFFERPDVIGNARSHRRGRGVRLAQRLVRPSEVVVEEVQAHGGVTIHIHGDVNDAERFQRMVVNALNNAARRMN